MLQRLFMVGIFAVVGALLASVPLSAQTLDKIKQRGILVVGTKADYKPFGFRDPSGNIVGFEPDLAKDVADRLGVKLQLEPVVSANRMQFLQQGKIDLMLATMNVTEERKKTVGIVEPSYYASGVNVLVNRKVALKSWDQLKEQKVCGIQGAFYNKYVAEKYGADPKWAAFEMPLETILTEPWGAAVRLEERDGPWGQFVAKTIADWHRTGKLIETEKKWNISPSAFLRKAREQTP